MAESLGEPGTIVHVLNLRYATLWGAPMLATRVEMSERARALAARQADPVPRFYASLFAAHAALEAGDAIRASVLLSEAHEVAGGLGQPTLDWYLAVTTAKQATVNAPLAEAERLIMHALAVGQKAGQPDALLWAAAQLAIVQRHQGRASEVVEYMEPFVAQPFTGSVPMLARVGLAASYCEVGRLDEAKALVESVTAENCRGMPIDFAWLATVALAAQVCWKVGGCRGAEAIHDLLAPYRHQFVDVGPGWLGSVAHYLGMIAAVLGRIEEADDAFAEAAAAHTRLGAHAWLAVTQAAWAELLVGSTTPEGARRGQALLTEAHATARRLGMVYLERCTSDRLAELRSTAGK